jgi:hypothetical protein
LNQSTYSSVASFDFLDGAPGSAGFDQLGLEQADDRLGERVVIGVPDGADRPADARGSEAFDERDGRVLGEFNRSLQHQAAGNSVGVHGLGQPIPTVAVTDPSLVAARANCGPC